MDIQPHETVFTGITISALPQHWEEAWKLLEPAIAYSNGRLTPKLIVDSLLAKNMQLWVAQGEELKAALVTEILTYATELKVCRIIACGGKNLETWMDDAVEMLSLWAKSLGCEFLELYGRPGWERKLKGWGKPFICLEKRLNGGTNGQE